MHFGCCICTTGSDKRASTNSHSGNQLRSELSSLPQYHDIRVLKLHVAHHLPFSDYILALSENGRIVEKGSYTELINSGGYIGSLSSTATNIDTERAPNLVLDEETLQELKLPEDENLDDTSRQTGDWSVYSYYFQHIGWPLLGLFLASCIVFVIGMITPRT